MNTPPRISIFVDGANMYYAQKRLGWFIDYRRVVQFFLNEEQGLLTEAYYYTGESEKDWKFFDYLNHNGYTVRSKPVKRMIDDNTGEYVDKANLDIEIVVDMFRTVSRYDICILMSGDGDFERALEEIRGLDGGKRIVVCAHPDMTARELKNVVGNGFYDLEKMERVVARTDRVVEPRE